VNPDRHTVAGHAGQAINVWDYGGTGPNLLLAHCTGGLARLWDPVAEELCASFRVLAPDTRGHGDSPLPRSTAACDWVYSGHDLLAVCRHFDLGPETLAAGHSAGGAMLAFAEHLAPGTFAKLALIDAIIGPRMVFSSRESPLAEGARRRRNTFESVDDARDRLSSKPPMSRWDSAVFEAYLAHGLEASPDGSVSLKLPGPWEAHFYEYGGACDVFENLGNLKLPILLVTAEGSRHVRELVKLQHDQLPESAMVDLPGLHHFIPQEDPAGTARLLAAWLAEGQLPEVYSAS
jgi:pimeloyl-ACP methyl ester carboxylesterase